MTVLLVLAGCLAVWFGGCWLAARKAPFLCDWCGLFIAHGEFEGHEPRCRAAHEPAGEVPSASPAALFDELGPLTDEEWIRFADAVGIDLEPWQRRLLNHWRIEDAAALRTQLTEDE